MIPKLVYQAFLFFSVFTNAFSQEPMGERVKNNARWKTENKANEKVDKAIDDVLEGRIFKKKEKPITEGWSW
jgi:hypothetical protein